MKQLAFSILAASFSAGGDSGWIFELFKTIRMNAINMSSVSVSLAMSVASIIVVFKLVLVSKNLMSDEQGSGFGNVKLWTVLRPIVILIMLSSVPQCVGALDDVANTISIGITNSVAKKDMKAQLGQLAAAHAAAIDEATQIEDFTKKMDEAGDLSSHVAEASSGGLLAAAIQSHKEKKALINEAAANVQAEKEAEENRQLTKGETKEIKKAIKRVYATHSKLTTDNDEMFAMGNGLFLPGVFTLIYDFLFKVIQCFAELSLCILAVLAPWVMVFALFDSNRGAIVNFGLRYMQISFWKVIAAVINFVVVEAACGNMAYQANAALKALQSDFDLGKVHVGGGITITGIMCVAGIFALLKVSDIAATIIPTSGGSFGDLGGAGAGFAGGLAKGAASVPGKAATAATGFAKKASSKVSQLN